MFTKIRRIPSGSSYNNSHKEVLLDHNQFFKQVLLDYNQQEQQDWHPVISP